ncbi:hypothetical protein ACP70R_004273 [Stipagrostis hirtigluma subsp. patula]
MSSSSIEPRHRSISKRFIDNFCFGGSALWFNGWICRCTEANAVHWRALQEMASESHSVAYCHECVLAVKGKPEGQLTADQEKEYTDANTIFLGAVIGVLADHLQDVTPQARRE